MTGARFAALALAATLVEPIAAADAVPQAEPGTTGRALERHAASGSGLLAAAERSPLVVAGRVGPTRRLDRHGFAADLVIDDVISGRIQLGTRLLVAWEELGSNPPERLAEGERVLVCLERLPSQSIWRQRIPEAGARANARLLADTGRALIRNPSQAELSTLEHYLALAPAARAGSAGVDRLVELVQIATPPLPRDALDRLADDERLTEHLTAASLETLLDAARDSKRPLAERKRIVETLGSRRIAGARDVLTAFAMDPSLEAAAIDAVAQIDGRLPGERVDALLTSDRADLRLVGIAWIEGAETRARLVSLVRQDPAPEVRLAALRRLLSKEGIAPLSEVAGILADPDAPTRSAAAHAIGTTSGSAAPLRALAAGKDDRIAEGAVVALSFAGPEGMSTLRAIHETDPRPSLRALAGLALGELPGHHH